MERASVESLLGMILQIVVVTDRRGKVEELALPAGTVPEAWIPPPSVRELFFFVLLFFCFVFVLIIIIFFQVPRDAFMGALEMLARPHDLVR